MQNCDEMPILDFTDLQEDQIEYFIYIVSELCEGIARERNVTIKIIKVDKNE